jgi:putative acetyltransferase
MPMYPGNASEELILIRTDSQNPDFAKLIKDLDANLQSRNGDMQEFFNQFNKVDQIKHVIVAYLNNVPTGCGAIKRYDNDAAEVKRMFVGEEYRGKGIAGKILNELENWAKELGYTNTILETSKAQHEAVALYAKKGYAVIDNYGQYEGIENSICFKKGL